MPNADQVRIEPETRASAWDVAQQRHRIGKLWHVREMLEAIPDPAIVVNGARQILAANEALAIAAGRPREALVGLRLGEALGCENVPFGPDGCGTSARCTDCGAARAQARCEAGEASAVESADVVRGRGDSLEAFDLIMSARPLRLDGLRLAMVLARDASAEKRRRELERIFFHDVLNTAGAIKGIHDVWGLLDAQEAAELQARARVLAGHLIDEIETQRDMALAEAGELRVRPTLLNPTEMLLDLASLYRTASCAEGKSIRVEADCRPAVLKADPVLLRRVLGNLLKNALEASHPGQTVSVAYHAESRSFTVHNDAVIPQSAQALVFQRSYSTKAGSGRGVGTWSVRLLSERYLKASVSFSSEPGRGTTFRVCLPREAAEPQDVFHEREAARAGA